MTFPVLGDKVLSEDKFIHPSKTKTMNQQTFLLIRHVSGSKKGQLEKFPVTGKTEIKIGRGADNDVRFDPIKEDTISREHCRIVQDVPGVLWLFSDNQV